MLFFVILVDPPGSIKGPFSPDAPRRVPGRDSGPIWGGFRTYLGCIFDSVFDDFLLCSSSVFDVGDVQNVYELGVKYGWVLHNLCQDSVECS